jgi:molybdate transport system permease protein
MALDWFPLWLSLRVAALATALSLPAGLALAWLMAQRATRDRGPAGVMAALPLALPPTVLGYYALALLAGQGWLRFTWPAAVAAAMVQAIPLLAISARAALEGLDRNYERAARSLGASGWRVFWRVSLPLARGPLAAAAALAFARSLGDFGVTLMVAGFVPGRGEMLDAALRQAAESGAGAPARVVAVLVSVAVIVVLALAGRLIPRQVQG